MKRVVFALLALTFLVGGIRKPAQNLYVDTENCEHSLELYAYVAFGFDLVMTFEESTCLWLPDSIDVRARCIDPDAIDPDYRTSPWVPALYVDSLVSRCPFPVR